MPDVLFEMVVVDTVLFSVTTELALVCCLVEVVVRRVVRITLVETVDVVLRGVVVLVDFGVVFLFVVPFLFVVWSFLVDDAFLQKKSRVFL